MRGDLQARIMKAVWSLREATVEDVRRVLPGRRRSAYTTVQTVLNRLTERGLLTRKRSGNAYSYRPRYEQADYLSHAIHERLDQAPMEVRREALIHFVEQLEPEELEEIARYATRIRRARTRS